MFDLLIYNEELDSWAILDSFETYKEALAVMFNEMDLCECQHTFFIEDRENPKCNSIHVKT